MTRAELIGRVRARGLPVLVHHVETAAANGHLAPPPELDAGHRRTYVDAHEEQLAAYVARVVERREARVAARSAT